MTSNKGFLLDSLFLFAALVFVAGLVMVGDTYMHEQAHVAIQEAYGCVDSEMHYGPLGGETVCHRYLNRSIDDFVQERYLHELNEVVGYNLQGIYVLVVAMGVAGLLIISYQKRKYA